MQRLTNTICLTLAMLWIAAGALARPPHHEPPGELIAEHAEELGIDDETLEKITAIAERTRAEAAKLRRAHRKAGATLHELLELEEPDEAAVMNQADVVGEIDSQRRKLRLRALLEIRSLLTPEQRQKLVELERERRPDRAQRRRDRRERMRACEPDVALYCGDAVRPREVFRCLEEHRDDLAPECSTAFDELRDEMESRHRGDRF